MPCAAPHTVPVACLGFVGRVHRPFIAWIKARMCSLLVKDDVLVAQWRLSHEIRSFYSMAYQGVASSATQVVAPPVPSASEFMSGRALS